MFAFLSFLALLAIAYLAWRIVDLLPDVVFRLSEVQRDVAEIRRRGEAAAPEVDAAEGAAETEDGAPAQPGAGGAGS